MIRFVGPGEAFNEVGVLAGTANEVTVAALQPAAVCIVQRDVLLGLKHILVLGMTAIALYRSLVLGRRGKASTPSREKLSAGLLFLNLILGIGVLFVTGLAVSLSSGPPLG